MYVPRSSLRHPGTPVDRLPRIRTGVGVRPEIRAPPARLEPADRSLAVLGLAELFDPVKDDRRSVEAGAVLRRPDQITALVAERATGRTRAAYVGDDRVARVRLPRPAERPGGEEEELIVGRGAWNGNIGEQPIAPVVLDERRIDRPDVAHDHRIEGPLARKRPGLVELDRAAGRGLREHERVVSHEEHERVREVIRALEHDLRLCAGSIRRQPAAGDDALAAGEAEVLEEQVGRAIPVYEAWVGIEAIAWRDEHGCGVERLGGRQAEPPPPISDEPLLVRERLACLLARESARDPPTEAEHLTVGRSATDRRRPACSLTPPLDGEIAVAVHVAQLAEHELGALRADAAAAAVKRDRIGRRERSVDHVIRV